MTTFAAHLPSVRTDTLPENVSYRDDGCDVSLSCLNCPLPVCKFDDPGWLQRQDRRSRDAKILAMRNSGMLVADIAVRFNVSSRTVHRVIGRGGTGPMTAVAELDERPAITLQELARRTLIHARMPWPGLFSSRPSLRA